MSETTTITVDGREVEAGNGEMLLSVLRENGVQIPTLCHHPSLEPSGACRLCVVEISHPDWKGWSGLVTSCLYPVEPGLLVFTRSEKVVDARRSLLELYIARCPDSDEVRAVARAEGVDGTPFPAAEGADLCIMCGLCTRVCNDLGPAAIAPLGRGTDKVVGPRPDLVGEDCTACGACALICPTGEITMEHRDTAHHIWNRAFPIDVCQVTPESCRGCGVCEEACPIAVPRVTPSRQGDPLARISPTACVGCGICAGACPTGAITQNGDAPVPSGDLQGRTIVYACTRSAFQEITEDMIVVPCIGRVPIETILELMAGGANGVLLMCRDQATCPYGLGGAMAERRVRIAHGMTVSARLGPGRIAYVKPAAGRKGPDEAYEEFRAGLASSPLTGRYVPDPGTRGMDLGLDIMGWLRERPELARTMPEVDTLLYLGEYHDLDLFLSLLVRGWRLSEIFEDAVHLLHDKGIRFVPAFTPGEVERSDASRVITFPGDEEIRFNRDVEIVSLDALAGTGSDGTDSRFHFHLQPGERREILDRLGKTRGVHICSGPGELAQARFLTREGAWLEAEYGETGLAFGKAVRAAAGEERA